VPERLDERRRAERLDHRVDQHTGRPPIEKTEQQGVDLG
jgi:hypothetical protein